MMKVYAFRWVPPFAQGLVRDLRVRWALEEAGLPYEERLLSFEDQTSATYRRLQPFGQVPVLEDGALTLFESGEIVLHVAERTETLMPHDPAAQARMRTWMFAALNSIEPFIANLSEIDLFNADQDWAKQRRPAVLASVEKRLRDLSTWLGDRDYLEDRFTAADLLMTTVLRNLRHTDLVARLPNVEAYQKRCEARPAFGRALAAQLRAFEANAPPAQPS
ncbi:MAG: Glutathione S-transferase [Labilithrix sp.]|nr:Glutathione S-transferase [Labilithrix sp.]